jgi:ribosomal protein S12 methylthiotransferase accessory factor
LLRGSTLRLKSAQGELCVKAPQAFLRALYEECDGRASLADMERAKPLGVRSLRFIAFVRDMLEAGVLADALGAAGRAFDAAQLPSTLGATADRATWEAARLGGAGEDEAGSPELLPFAQAATLRALLEARRSAPAFGELSLADTQLAALLDAMYGICRSDAGGDVLPRRSVASAGGFKSLRLSLVLLRPVGSIQPGVFSVRYRNGESVALDRVAEETSQWCAALLEPHLWSAASGLIAISADISAATLKYRNRALQFALLEAGAVLQNAGLAAADLGLALRALGGYYADRVATLCRIVSGRILCCAVVGTSAQSATESVRADMRRAVEFSWMENASPSDLHIAKAEVNGTDGRQAIGWGRSIDSRQACVVAIAEASERYSCGILGKECLAATADDLDRVIASASLATYAQSQYRRAALGVCRFDSKREYLWARATSLSSAEPAWVPAEFVYPATAIPKRYAAHALARATSSGCASDGSAAVAIERAAYEVIERDALARHWLAQRAGIAITSNSCDDATRKRIRGLEQAGCQVILQILDAGLGPVVLAFVTSDRLAFSAVGTACGAELTPAIERALGEAEVIALSRLRGTRPRPLRARDSAKPMDHAELYATRRHYRRAWVLVQETAAEDLGTLAKRWPIDLSTRLKLRTPTPPDLFWVDVTADDAPVGFDGRPLTTVRALIPGCIPIAFGFDAIPRGTVGPVSAAGRFPHPMA